MPELQVRESPYEQHRDYVLAVLARRCGWLDGSDREAVFHDAYAVLLEKERDGRLDASSMHPQQVRAYLTQTSIHKALDEGKRAGRKRSEPLGDRALAEPDGRPAPDEVAASSLDNARLREIVGELPERQQTIVKLRFFFDRTPEEIQRYLDLSERAYRRELERAMRHVYEQFDLVRKGEFCDSRRSMILAYVGGFAGPNRALEARNHLSTCPGCAHWAGQLRLATERAAAVFPLPPLVSDHGPLTRLGELLAELAAAGKQQVVALLTRADPGTAGYASAARPGAVVAAVAGCIAVGGGATYCAVEGVPGPLRSLVAPARAERPQPKHKPPVTRAKIAAQRTPIATPTPTPRPKDPAPRRERREPRPAATPAPTVVPTASPPVQEFGLEGSGQPAGSSPSAPAPSTSSPPAGPPGEFDP